MYWVKTPKILKHLFPQQTWSMEGAGKKIFLTFDDGPTPGITKLVLQELNRFQAKATFFMVGKSAESHQELMNEVKINGHAIGNHSYNHLNGWKSSTKKYLDDVGQCDKLLHSKLFRPPFGRITPAQTRHLATKFRIIMWDVLSGDFDQTISKEQCLKNVLRNTEQGSIIVFHDSIKAADRMLYTLPRVLEHFSEREYAFAPLSQT